MIGIDSKHYPETLGRMFIINVPTIFSIAWALIAPFLDERTQKKIEIFASESAWKKRLRECIDPAKLPEEYGGDNKVPVYPGSKTRRGTVASGKTLTAKTDTLSAGTTIRWRWFSRPSDLSFSVNFVPLAGGGGGGAPASPPPSYSSPSHPDSEKKTVDVTLTAPGPGHFVAVWGNTSGWMGWKREVFYRWDEVLSGGKIKPVGGLSGVASAIGTGASIPVISESVLRVPDEAENGGGGGGARPAETEA